MGLPWYRDPLVIQQELDYCLVTEHGLLSLKHSLMLWVAPLHTIDVGRADGNMPMEEAVDGCLNILGYCIKSCLALIIVKFRIGRLLFPKANDRCLILLVANYQKAYILHLPNHFS